MVREGVVEARSAMVRSGTQSATWTADLAVTGGAGTLDLRDRVTICLREWRREAGDDPVLGASRVWTAHARCCCDE